MKKVLIILTTALICVFIPFSAFANEEETTQDASQPRLMVTEYKVENGYIMPSSKSNLEIKFKNYSNKKALYNVKLSIADESGEIKTESMPTAYVERIYAGSSYTWKIPLTASTTAQIGEHKLTVTAEYEDKYFTPYTATDTINVTVKQTVGLDYDGIILPAKLIQGDTVTMEVNLMNTGKTDIRNAKLSFDIENTQTGGVLFIGEIPAGQSSTGSANLKVSDDKTGEITGTVTLSYEDAFGESYSKEIDVSSVIEKKTEVAETDEEKEEKKNPLWWVFLIVGLTAGLAAGIAIPTAIRNSKQRKEDELRL